MISVHGDNAQVMKLHSSYCYLTILGRTKGVSGIESIFKQVATKSAHCEFGLHTSNMVTVKILEYLATIDPRKNRKYCFELLGNFCALSMDIGTFVYELSKDLD